ncbi:F-box protein At4g00755 isoform X1 [Physcomitrium patens]|uniref:Uncharacterized protein n=1 Tax=Physcomitrium patens TaxID=3218 RepID=A0A2K1L3M8_PHYPA|nr:F-box protein At4g00755-like isoform X1 [Physcomitrium patens]XP_024403243.1 F-box protein At4g00755-like isoform X1 [Physcomitrium patens]PNR60621.1 hypothetical protein PHYPA_003414 [Physcomitrium patens]|eukprot:XP_024403234.1 F-box protein At4g00755-like isoform X1 [Physcomitrella patens]
MDLQSWKECCLDEFPEVKSFEKFIMTKSSPDTQVDGSSEILDMEERKYRHLLRELKREPLIERSCIREAVKASSTDNYPEESIDQTLYTEGVLSDQQTPSYWSSSGQGDVNWPETLTYNLVSDLCVIYEVRIHPFRAFFQFGQPIYSAKNVRIRHGHAIKSSPTPESASAIEVPYVCTYESPEFAMEQVDSLQVFKLPRPILCIGGVMQVELLGRVQTQQMDNLYYICIQHVSVVGRPLSGFKLHPFEEQRKFTLEYCGHDKLLEPDNVPYLSSGKGNPTQFRKFQGTSSQPNLKSTSKRNLMLDVLDQIPRQPSPVSVPLINNSGTSSSGSIEGGESQFRKYEGGLPDAEPELTPKRNLMLDIMRQISSQKNSTYSGNFVKNVRAPEGDRIAEA